MTLLWAILVFFVAVSFTLGLYFRIAEYDVLAADRVWERIGPAAIRIAEDERVPDEIASDVAAFSILTGCGCFTNAILWASIKRKLGFDAPPPPEAFQHQVANLDGETRRLLYNLMRDLVLFDSLHAPILGRICRACHRKHFARAKYRVEDDGSAEREEMAIARIAQTAETVIAAKADRMPEFA